MRTKVMLFALLGLVSLSLIGERVSGENEHKKARYL